MIAGYSFNDFAVAKRDDLFMSGLCCDDGQDKVLLISFDLQALDEFFIREMREKCGALLNIPQEAVMLTCTHNHSGPQTICEAGHEADLHTEYMKFLGDAILEETAGLSGKFVEVDLYFYSSKIDANTNRRYVSPDNYASFLPYCNFMRELADGFADKEFGSLFFRDKKSGEICYGIGNYAAHPLAGHAPALGGKVISADFPGAFRNYVTGETGVEVMFISGALGDMVPKGDELGSDSVEKMGIALGKEFIRSMIGATRAPDRFKVDDPKVGAIIRKLTVPLRKKFRNNPATMPKHYLGSDVHELEVQCIAIGDICFVGMPGEVCAELGQEVKWHSPFRRTFIAFVATAYIDYVCPGNFLVSGGYEGRMHHFSARNSIDLVKCAVDAAYELRDMMYPAPGDEPYPDYLDSGLVNLYPGKNS